MAGPAVSYDEIPYFYTDQFDLGMEYSGYGNWPTDAEVVVRGDLARREFIAFWVRRRRVVAGMNVNVWDVNETVQALHQDRGARGSRLGWQIRPLLWRPAGLRDRVEGPRVRRPRSPRIGHGPLELSATLLRIRSAASAAASLRLLPRRSR